MSLNCAEINLILSELDLQGSLIQDVIQPGYDTLVFHLYKNGKAFSLLICTASNACRINSTTKKIPKNEKPLRFMELLKSKIKGARIKNAFQIGLERIIVFELTHAGEQFFLYVRLWSNAANVILCNSENIIIDALYRRPKKNEMTGEVFTPPIPDNSKLEKNWEVRDFSEMQEGTKNTSDTNAHTPTTLSSNEKVSLNETMSFNEKVDTWYSEHGKALSKEVLLLQATKWYENTKGKYESSLFHLQKKLNDFENADRYKHYGDLILSFGNKEALQKGVLDCIDYETNASVHLILNSKKSVHENAAEYYTKYKKSKSGIEQLERDILVEQNRLAKLEETYKKICNEENPVRIEQLIRKSTTPQQQKKKDTPGLRYVLQGYIVLVGRDANENDALLRHHVRGNDMWLHVRDFSGGYVFIKNKTTSPILQSVLQDAANLALYYSKARKQGKADLYYTEVKYLRRAKNGPKGLVIPTQEKNLFVTLNTSRIAELDEYKM